MYKVGDVFNDTDAMTCGIFLSVIDRIIYYDEDDSCEYIMRALYIDKSNPQRIKVEQFTYVMTQDDLYRDAIKLSI